MVLRLQTKLCEGPLINHVKRYGKSGVLHFLGGFPLRRNFILRSRKKFTCVNEIEAIYERPKGSTLTCTRDLLYIFFISFTRTYWRITRQWKSKPSEWISTWFLCACAKFTLRLTAAFHTLPIYIVYASQKIYVRNYATEEIHPVTLNPRTPW